MALLCARGSDALVVVEEAGDLVPGFHFLELGLALQALVHALPAAVVEVAAGAHLVRRGHVAREDDALARPSRPGIRDGRRREQGLGVGMQGLLVEVRRAGDLGDDAEVHDRHAGGDVLDDREVVGDEEVGEAELLLEVLEEVEDLGLDGDVEGRDGLVAEHQLGPQGEGAGDADALALAAGELVGVAVLEEAGEAHALHELLDPLVHLLLGHVRGCRAAGRSAWARR